MEAFTGLEAPVLALGSASGHFGDRIGDGGRMGIPMPIPIRTRPHRSSPNPHSSCRASLPRPHPPGTTVTIRRAITRMSSNAPVVGERSHRHHRRCPSMASILVWGPGGMGGGGVVAGSLNRPSLGIVEDGRHRL